MPSSEQQETTVLFLFKPDKIIQLLIQVLGHSVLYKRWLTISSLEKGVFGLTP